MKWKILLLLSFLSFPTLCFAVSVPDCVGDDFNTCQSSLESLGFVCVGESEYCLEIIGDVCRTSPISGTDLSFGSSVSVFVSLGSLTPEAYNYMGFVYCLLGLVGSLSFISGLSLAVKSWGVFLG